MQIMNTKIRGEYPAPNNVILSRAVNLTARGLQIHQISVAQITIQNDCTLLVDFLVDVAGQITAGRNCAAITAFAQERLVSQGVPLTAQRLLGMEGINSAASGQSMVRIQCHFFVEPQQSWRDESYFGLTLLCLPQRLKMQVKSYRRWIGDLDDVLSFVSDQLLLTPATYFLRNLYLKFPWHQHWLLKEAYYQTSPVDPDGKSFWVTYKPFEYGFGTIMAPYCNMGIIGELLFTHALRPAMFTC